MECERPGDGSLRQGDILAAHPETANWSDPWRRLGVVLSADCDLEQGKVGTDLVYAPIVGLPVYVAHTWIPQQATKLREEAEKRLTKLLSQFSGSEITSRHVLRWEPSELAGRLAQEPTGDPAARQKTADKIVAIREAVDRLGSVSATGPALSLDSLQAAIERYFSCSEVIVPPAQQANTNSRRATLLAVLHGLAEKDRADTWVLCDLYGLDPEMRDQQTYGFVVDLRRFSKLQVSHVHLERKLWLENPDGYIRVARLRGIYKSDLLQRFANLFIRVGLEDERNEMHRHIFERTAKKLIPDPQS